MSATLTITNEQQEQAEREIREKRKTVDYNTIEYPIEIIVQKYRDGEEDDVNELFIPDYQREMAWDEDQQSKFIESIFLGLPIPYIFVADVSSEDGTNEARLEIIDGTQRVRTLSKFINNELQLRNLNKLKSLNNFTFADLPLARQRRFKRTTIRMIQLTEAADEEVRRDLFERINTGSVELNKMEKRRGIYPGAFLNLIEELSQDSLFRQLCPFSEVAIDRREPQEFVLRFFAFLHEYDQFSGKVHEFLDSYLQKTNSAPQNMINEMKNEFLSMLKFVERYFPKSFRVGKHQDKLTTRIKFESISVGVALALKHNENLIPKSTEFLNSAEFKKYTQADGSSSKNKVKRRIKYVYHQLIS